MGVEVTLDENRIPELLEQLEYLKSHTLEVGILGDETDSEILLRANVHEFGAPSINVPERSFIRSGWDQHENEIQRTAEMLLDAVFAGSITAEAMFEALGGEIVSVMQEFVEKLSFPPLKQATIDRSGRSNPLIDTGQMRGSITWRVV